MKKNLDIKLMLLGLGCMGYAASVCSYFVTRTQNSFYESAQAFLCCSAICRRGAAAHWIFP